VITKISNPYRLFIMGFKALIVLMTLLSGIIGVADADGSLTATELLGRQIYREGTDNSQHEITVTLGLTEDSVPATTFACANCHGLEGEGKQEGGLTVPALTSQQLFANTISNTQAKSTYNETTLLQAITKGINAQNKILSAAMPRYHLTDNQAQALFAYLKRLGSTADVDVGVNGSEVQLATLLPLTGALETTGKILKATLDACIAEVNEQGLIYGRKLTLTAVDSGSTKEDILASAQRLLTKTKSFALISGYFPEISPELFEMFTQEKIPVIAPLTFMPDSNLTPSSSFFYFLPSYEDQSRALIDYWLTHVSKENGSKSPKLAIIHSDRTIDLKVAEAIREQLQRNQLNVAADVVISQTTQKPADNQLTRLESVNPDAVFFIGTAKELASFNKLMPKKGHQPILLGLLAMLGADVINIPGLTLTKMLLANPFDLNDPEMPQFLDIMKKYSVTMQSPGLQRIACAAVNFVAEGLKRTGKHLTRVKFTCSLDETKNFPLGIMPPLQFGPNRRQGVKGAYILTVDIKTRTLSPLSEWMIPSEVLVMVN
jgi:ABC-type branched-subunit amino acid transport system substrate-binding protein